MHDFSKEIQHAIPGLTHKSRRMSAEEWEARVDLAAAHRLAVMLLAGKQVQRA